jgi:arabinose-5-phosphate isomerase
LTASTDLDEELEAATEPLPWGPAEAIAAGRQVLDTEARALARLSETLDDSFARAVETVAAVRGRVVLTGMGKSGHIARKIAATLASTGTAAMYVHPGEASHGDLGMVTRDDAVLALSNSGETAELNDMVEHATRFHIPLLAIVGRPDSTLANSADVALVLPDMPEACPHGMAPTTSTTMALAIGDALAVALVVRSGFTGIDFRLLHPGGSLGTRLRTVADLMHGADVMPLVAAATPMAEALLIMTTKSFGCVGVTGADGGLIGIVTDGDLRRHMAPELLSMAAGEVMTPDPKVIGSKHLAAEALWVMSTGKITSLFVVDDGSPVGILHLHDCLRAGIA